MAEADDPLWQAAAARGITRAEFDAAYHRHGVGGVVALVGERIALPGPRRWTPEEVWDLAGVEPEVRIVPFRGEYYELRPERRDLVRGLIYPVPDPELPFLGVHLTRMIDGSVHAGPNAVLALAREGYRWRDVRLRDAAEALTYPGFLRMASRNIGTGAREVARSLSRNAFARSLARLVPAIEAADIVRAGSGVRAQAVRPDGALAVPARVAQALEFPLSGDGFRSRKAAPPHDPPRA